MTATSWDDAREDVRDRVPLEEVVRRYVSLRQSGSGRVGLCPFHDEKTPSFHVNPERGFFHCFGCGESGDLFTFVMKMEGLSFREALEKLASEAGVELPKGRGETRDRGERDRLENAHRVAGRWFWRMLRDPVAGEKARAYLDERGVGEESRKTYAVGYAPASGLESVLREEKVAIADAKALGLLGTGHGTYDRFRNRIIFPITDLSGRVAGFGGRSLPGDDSGPKYLNSPESPLFRKRSLLFGLPQARDAIRQRDEVFVVEGYLDVIALAQAGVPNAVAPLGTALTLEQVRLLRRFTERIVLLFDGDEAGRRAAARSFPVLAEAGIFGDAVFLPAGEDPDTFVRGKPADEVAESLSKRTALVDFYLGTLAPPDADLAARRKGAATLTEMASKLPDRVFAGLLVRRAAHHFDIPEDSLRAAPRPAPAGRPDDASTPDDRPPEAPWPNGERLLAELLVVHPELVDRVPESIHGLLSVEPAVRFFDAARASGAKTADLLPLLPEASRIRVTEALQAPDTVALHYDPADEILVDCLRKLVKSRVAEALRRLQTRLKEADQAHEASKVDEIVAEKSRVQRLGQQAAESLADDAIRELVAQTER